MIYSISNRIKSSHKAQWETAWANFHTKFGRPYSPDESKVATICSLVEGAFRGDPPLGSEPRDLDWEVLLKDFRDTVSECSKLRFN